MNASLKFTARSPHWIARFALITIATCNLAASAAEPASTPPKTHRLFMGSNLSVVSKDSSLPVSDVRNNSFVVKGPRGDLVVSAQDKQSQIKIDDALKLTTAFATVDNLTFDRIYTAGNDPMRKFEDAARVSAALSDATDVGTQGVRDAEGGVARASMQGGQQGIEAQKAAADNMASNQSALDRTIVASSSDAFSLVTSSSRMASEIAAEAFDALRVTFSISSPKPLTTPYVVIFMRFLAEKDRPETATVWVYAEKLPDLDEHPRKITIMRGGFPPGYHIDSHHVHLYEGSSEIATSVSRKQMELTTDEAFQYSIIQHISGNRDQTKAPAKSSFFWPKDLSSRLHPDNRTRTVFVKVGKDGKALGLFEDKACNRPISDKELTELTPELRFLPGLEKGKPVESVAAVKLGARD
jgi:hypothetical protein